MLRKLTSTSKPYLSTDILLTRQLLEMGSSVDVIRGEENSSRAHFLQSPKESEESFVIRILAGNTNNPSLSECSHNIYIETIDGGFRPLSITIFWQQDTIYYYASSTIIHTNLSHLAAHTGGKQFVQKVKS